MQSKEEVHNFEKLEQQLHAFLSEISELSKKKPNDGLNKFKLKFINTTLEALNTLLGDHRPFADFATFNVDELPTNSDVVLLLSQYAAAAYNFRREHTTRESITWYWIVRGKQSDLQTESPEHFKVHQK